MKYVHIYDNFIVEKLRHSELGSNLTQIHKELKKQYYGISKKTVYNHLQKLQSQGFIDKDDDEQPREHNEKLYRLTYTTQKELEYGLSNFNFKGLNESQFDKRRKAFFMLLAGASLGNSESRKVGRKLEPGFVLLYNTRTGQREAYESYTEEGVTVEDLVESKNTRIDGSLFTGNLTELEVHELMNILTEEFGFRPKMTQIVRKNGNIGIRIVDDSLREFVTYLVAIIGYVDIRAEDIFKLDIYARLYEKEISGREKRKRKVWKKYLRQYKEMYKWYILIFGKRGRERFNFLSKYTENEYNDLLKHVIQTQKYNDNVKSRKKILKKEKIKGLYTRLQSAIRVISGWDVGIVNMYHSHVVCDKYDQFIPREYRPRYDRYRNYVKNMPQNHRIFMDKFIEMVYPYFLKRYHQTDTELVEYIRKMPGSPLS